MNETAIDFTRSYLRFYLDFENRQPISLSHPPPVRTNRTRILLEATCQLTHQATGDSTTYVLSAACKTEHVGGAEGNLWMQPNADCIFLKGDNGQFAVYKSWAFNDPGILLDPPTLGVQPERQTFHVDENFDECRFDLCRVPATELSTYDAVAAAILDDRPLVSRIEYTDGEFQVVIEQPVKTINLAERDQLFQTDTGPVLVPDLSSERRANERHFIGVFDLAYSAFHQPDWAEVVLRKPTPINENVSVNHYSESRVIRPCRNMLLQLE